LKVGTSKSVLEDFIYNTFQDYPYLKEPFKQPQPVQQKKKKKKKRGAEEEDDEEEEEVKEQ